MLKKKKTLAKFSCFSLCHSLFLLCDTQRRVSLLTHRKKDAVFLKGVLLAFWDGGAGDIACEAELALNDFLMNLVSTQKTSSTQKLLWQSKPAPKGVLPMLVGSQWATGDSIGSFCHGSESQWNRSSFGLGWYDPFSIKWELTAYVERKAHNIRILLMPYFDSRSWVFTAKRQSVAEWNQVALRDRKGDFLKHLLQKTTLGVGAMTPRATGFHFHAIIWISTCKLQLDLGP